MKSESFLNHEPNALAEDITNYETNQMENNSVHVSFSKSVEKFRVAELTPAPCRFRADLRGLKAFTIDCDSTKDMDDAVSIERRGTGFRLGVHIADVSAYVRPGLALDREATERGTSIYLPLTTVPMLPDYLSDNLCSLKEGTDRNTISVLMDLDSNGNVARYSIGKSLICSKVKGSYSDVNSILDGTAQPEIVQRYAEVLDSLSVMRELAQLLRANRRRAGANLSVNIQRRFALRDNELELAMENHGAAGQIIEEFMVLTNRIVAEFFSDHSLPAIYRTQKEKKTQASYGFGVCRHAELALDKYIHFTSPIRRLADLKIHQVLTAFLDGIPVDTIHYMFDDMLKEACEYATKRSRRADSIQNACAKYCCGKYFKAHPWDRYRGTVTGYSRNGASIILMDGLGVSVLWRAPVRAAVGSRYSLMVTVDDAANNLIACGAKAIA